MHPLHKEYTHIMHTLTRNAKRVALLVALAVTMAFPASVFAADATSNTTESLTVASTVSMTAPASTTYTLGDEDGANGPDFNTHIVVTVLASNNPSGITVKAQVDPFVTAGDISVATTERSTLLDNIDCASANQVIGTYTCPASPAPVAASGATLTKAFAQNLSAFADSSSVVPVASSTGALANADLGVTFFIDEGAFPVGGDYTSAVHWTTSTNP